ncbi:MAG: ABC transporter ATP-binding protein [Dermatophilus congolensis]|nr:ABC transporter ATP-binding protein [Dermatophilus congolensis]
MSGSVLELVDVTRVHGAGEAEVRALDGVSLRVEAGELVAVMGPSGSGKSTLLNLAGGLDRATSGRVLVNGADLGDMGQDELATLRRRAVGFVFQDFNLVGSLTAAENIGLPLELDGLSIADVRAKALEALTEIGLAEVADRFPDEMSGGQRQRVAIARALIGSRSLVLADEPTGAVDSVTGEGILRLLRSRIDSGAAGLLVTHEPRHAAWADRVIYLRDGRIVEGSEPRSA